MSIAVNDLCFCGISTMVFAIRELEVANVLGKVWGLACIREERTIIAIIYCDLNLLL